MAYWCSYKMYWNIAVCSIVILLIVWIVLSNKKSKKPKSTIPGPTPIDVADGNIQDIKLAGGLHEYLCNLHKKYGPIVSFWLKNQQVVSIASPDLFKQHQNVFDRPVELFQMFIDLIGYNSIQLRNGVDGQTLHKAFSRPFAFSECKKYYSYFHTIGHGLVEKIKSLPPDTHVPVHEYMNVVAIKGILASAFGHELPDDKAAVDINAMYNKVWDKIESYFKQSKSVDFDEEEIKEAALKFRKLAEEILDAREKSSTSENEMFVDVLLSTEETKESKIDNAITFITGGFHTTANLLTWMIYYLAKEHQIQDRVYEEIRDGLGNEDVSPETMKNLKFMQQVIDETLRLSVLAPYAARVSETDTVLNGYCVPARTPVVHALGVVLSDERNWKDSEKFDPDRFSPEAIKTRPTLQFSPFGFAGKRICPGYRFAYVETTIIMSLLLRNFKLHLVEGQTISKVHGLVTKPSTEVWVTFESRNVNS